VGRRRSARGATDAKLLVVEEVPLVEAVAGLKRLEGKVEVFDDKGGGRRFEEEEEEGWSEGGK
jgi:hypothetical protein